MRYTSPFAGTFALFGSQRAVRKELNESKKEPLLKPLSQFSVTLLLVCKIAVPPLKRIRKDGAELILSDRQGLDKTHRISDAFILLHHRDFSALGSRHARSKVNISDLGLSIFGKVSALFNLDAFIFFLFFPFSFL
jgi:hypothetical protein